MTVTKVIYDLFDMPDKAKVKPGGFSPFYAIDGKEFAGVSGHFESGEQFTTWTPLDDLEQTYGRLLDLIGHTVELAALELKGETASGTTKVKFKMRDLQDLGLASDEAVARAAHPAGSNSGAGPVPAGGHADAAPERVGAPSSPTPAPRPTPSSSHDAKDRAITTAVVVKYLTEMSEDLRDPDARRAWVHSLLAEEVEWFLGVSK